MQHKERCVWIREVGRKALDSLKTVWSWVCACVCPVLLIDCHCTQGQQSQDKVRRTQPKCDIKALRIPTLWFSWGQLTEERGEPSGDYVWLETQVFPWETRHSCKSFCINHYRIEAKRMSTLMFILYFCSCILARSPSHTCVVTINNRHRLSRNASQKISVFIHPKRDVYRKVKLSTQVKYFEIQLWSFFLKTFIGGNSKKTSQEHFGWFSGNSVIVGHFGLIFEDA